MVRRYKAITQLITAAPCNALPARILVHLTALGLSVEIADLTLLSVAARFRLARGNPRLQQLVDEVEAARHGDGLALAGLPMWHGIHVAPLSLAQVHLALADPRLQHLPLSAACSPQKAAMRLLRLNRPTATTLGLLRVRVALWMPGVTDAVLDVFVARVKACGRKGLHFLCAGVLRFLLRGWCTSTHFGIRDRACVFGCGDDDRFGHYLVCPRLWSADTLAHLRILMLEPGTLARIGQLCLLAPRPADSRSGWDVVALAVIDAIHFAYNSAKHDRSQRDASKLVRARLAALCRRHRHVRVEIEHLFRLQSGQQR